MADREFTNINGIKVCDQTARNSIPTKTSQLENDSNFVTDSVVDEKIANAQLNGGGEVDLSSYAKITDLPTKTSQLTNDSGYITNIPDEYITETELNAKGYATTSQIPTVPTNVSEFTNDAHYASETFVTNKIAEASLSGGTVDLSGYVTKETGNANQITFADGQTFQAKLDAGTFKGDKGDAGAQGPAGADGQTPNITIGTVTTLAAGSNATASITGDTPNLTLNLGIPKGADGSGGSVSDTSGYKVYNVLDYNISASNEDNTPALQSLMNLVSDNGGGTIFFPVGTYKFKKASTQEEGTYFAGHEYAVLAKSNVSIIGENIENTILKCVEATPYSLFYRFIGDTSNTIHGCTYSNFTVDCYDTGSINKVFGKVFYYQYVKDCIFRDLILKGSTATAMGTDFLDNVEINNVTCIDCGRTFINETATKGTSGIGIGTGGFENENFKITNCVCVGCGQYGIFIENQHALNMGGKIDDSKGCIISNCITRNGLYRGIGVRGGTNVIVSNCNSYENAQDGIYLDSKCVNVKISNNNIVGNKSNGILVKSNSNSEDIDINDNFIKGNTNYGILLSANTNGLMLRHNVTKGNTKGGLHSESGLSHSDAIARDNIFIDGEDTTNNLFTGITAYNDLLKSTDVVITSITCNNFSVKQSATKTVSYSVTPSNADKTKVTISTTDTNYITVDNAAKTVTGIAEGTATLTLEANGVTTTATVTVLSANTPSLITVENSEFITNYKLQEDGAIIGANNAGVTDYIDISSFADSSKLKIDLYEFSLKSGGRICFYDSNKTIVSTETAYTGADTGMGLYTMKINMSSDYSYMRVSYNILGSGHVKITNIANDTLNIASNEFITGLKIMPDGSTAADNTAYSTDYIDITEFVNAGYTNVNIKRSNTTGAIRLGQYDSSKASLSSSFAITNPPNSGLDVTLLSGVMYIRLMFSTGTSTCEATLTFS